MFFFDRKLYLKEWFLHTVFLIVLFFLYSFDKHSPSFEWFKVAFFLSYATYALVIDYVCLPLFLYKKKYKLFFFSLLFIFGTAYYVEEYVLEQLFFTNERASFISGVVFTLLDIVPLVITMVSFKLVWDARKRQMEVDQLKLTVNESELKFLKAQINPHFLFNNLNNLYSYAIERSEKTPSIILELSSVLRYMLYDCKEKFVPLVAEVKHLEHYIRLSELQVEERGDVEFISEVKSNDYAIAPLILSVFVENAFKHSTASQSKLINIKVKVHVSNVGELHFYCENSHSSDVNVQGLSEGIGLENVRKRLNIIYPKKYTLDIKKTESCYVVNLKIKLNA